jgi:hypothetical protein
MQNTCHSWHTGARPTIQNSENKKLLALFGSFTLTSTLITVAFVTSKFFIFRHFFSRRAPAMGLQVLSSLLAFRKGSREVWHTRILGAGLVFTWCTLIIRLLVTTLQAIQILKLRLYSYDASGSIRLYHTLASYDTSGIIRL